MCEAMQGDSIFEIAKQYNTTPEIIQDLNLLRYPGLATYPYMIFYGWNLTIPLVGNGGNNSYGSP